MQVDELNGLQSGLIRIGTFSSPSTHWLPNIIREFQKDYPHIDYELLLGDYAEIENWIAEGRVDCGFVCLPTRSEFETIFLDEDPFMVIMPEDHPLASLPVFPVASLCDYPFMLMEKGEKQKSLLFSPSMACLRKFILPPGMTTQLCLWWKADSVSVSFQS